MDPSSIWLKKAFEDFDTARFNHTHNRYPFAAFLYQQAVEKALKSVIIKHGNQFPKIHDCAVLAKLAGAPLEIIELAEVLTSYYFKTRYPDEDLKPLPSCEVTILFKNATEILRWIKENC